jgi:hypothetical protein
VTDVEVVLALTKAGWVVRRYPTGSGPFTFVVLSK